MKLVLAFFGLCISLSAWSQQPTWAKKAAGFAPECNVQKSGACQPINVPSPNGKSRIEVRYRKVEGVLSAYLRVIGPDGRVRIAHLVDGSSEILWSPDSKAFFVNGTIGATSGHFVRVYRLDSLKPLDPTGRAQRAMIRSFPPCKAKYALDTCKDVEKDPGYNMSGIDWASGSSLVVIAEVPCTSWYGGIMCQVMGYELAVPSGRILKAMLPSEFRQRWQGSMAWEFHLPEPAEYAPQ